MNRGCCNVCGYKADYIIDKNNYEDNGYKDLDHVPFDKMLCGVCYEENCITNYKKFNWYDTQAYKLNGDNNDGYIYGYVEWYGYQDLDDAIDNEEDVSWSWFKTKQERDKKLRRENELQNI